MAKHVITLEIELDDTNEANTPNALEELSTGLVSHVIATMWPGSPERSLDGYSGPYLQTIIATLDGEEVNV